MISSPGMMGGELQAWRLINSTIMMDKTRGDVMCVVCSIVGIPRMFVILPVPSRNSSALKHSSFSDTQRLDELFDHTGIKFIDGRQGKTEVAA